MILRCRQYQFTFPRPALVMGIVNVTPDSFFDGGQFQETDAAVARALEMIGEGAELIDIGGESTRPGATPVSEAQEMRRVLPVITALAKRAAVPLSIDTMKPGVARAAIAAGASLINDVGAQRADDTMARLVAQSGAGYVAMHMQGTPATMQRQPSYGDVVAEVEKFLGDQLAQLQAAGVAAEQVILDVGIGFGKTTEHNLQLLAALNRFTKLRRPLLLGVSRKSFLSPAGGAGADRLPGALACAAWARQEGVQIIRTHDVAATVRALRTIEAILAHRQS